MRDDGRAGGRGPSDRGRGHPARAAPSCSCSSATTPTSAAARDGRPRRAGPPAPAAGRALRPAVPQPRRAVRGPGPGRHDRPDQVDRPVRLRPRRRVLDVRHPDDHRRDQALLPRQGLGDPGAAPAAGAAHADRHGERRADPALGRSPTPRELAEAIGCTVEEIIEGIESSNAYSTLSLDASDDDDDGGAATMLDAIGVDDENLEHVEIRESIKPLLDRLDAAREADPAAAVLQEHDPVADRRGDRRLPDARLPAAQPDPRAAAHLAASSTEPVRAGRSPMSGCQRVPRSWLGSARVDARCAGAARRRARPARPRPARPPPRWCRRPGSSTRRPADQLGQHDRAARPRAGRGYSPQAQNSSPAPYAAKNSAVVSAHRDPVGARRWPPRARATAAPAPPAPRTRDQRARRGDRRRGRRRCSAGVVTAHVAPDVVL